VTTSAATRHAYGNDPSQFGELYRPQRAAHTGTVVIIHGGFWRAAYDLSLGAPLATDLARRGYTVWNLEYRRVGSDGGWPRTPADVAAGIDLLATLDVDTTKVAAIGHSAGGHLATWAAGRSALPAGAPGAAPRVLVTAVVAQAGVLDLATAADTGVGGTAVTDLLGGPGTPQRYALADPIRQVPLAAPVLCVHAKADLIVPITQSTAYVAAATKAGGRATLHETTGDHFTLIDPTSPDWRIVVKALPRLLTG
jgi:acetyl esterase/lipase